MDKCLCDSSSQKEFGLDLVILMSATKKNVFFLSWLLKLGHVSLDRRLNNNKLTGSIPREFAKLSNLKVMWVQSFIILGCFFNFHSHWLLVYPLACSDLSNNDLCGTIPVDGPFSTFPLRRYASKLTYHKFQIVFNIWQRLDFARFRLSNVIPKG
jgi:hypothetical protein